jgi:hypothetical protein
MTWAVDRGSRFHRTGAVRWPVDHDMTLRGEIETRIERATNVAIGT